jgi:hypothetical protein
MGMADQPEHWRERAEEARERAEEARILADDMASPSAKATMWQVAESYDRMAARSEVIAKSFANLPDGPERQKQN